MSALTRFRSTRSYTSGPNRWIPHRLRKTRHILRPLILFVAAILLLILARLDAPKPVDLNDVLWQQGQMTSRGSSRAHYLRQHSGTKIRRRQRAHSRARYRGAKMKRRNQLEVAIFLQVSTSSLTLLPRLLRRLYHKENLYLIHFDSEIDLNDGARALREANISSLLPDNVIILPQETINYRGVSMTLNTVSAMSAALDVSQNWRYFINLSGADYPLVTPSQLRWLLSHSGTAREFLSFAPDDSARTMLSQRMHKFAIDPALGFNNQKHAVAVHDPSTRNPLVDMLQLQPGYAEAWMIVSRAFCHYVTVSSMARRTLLLLSYTFSSPEHYFATLVRNTPRFNRTVVNQSMRLVMWSYANSSAGQHPFHIDDLYDLPTTEPRDFVKTPLLFARKFRRVSSKLMDDIDSQAGTLSQMRNVAHHFYAYLGKPVPRTIKFS